MIILYILTKVLNKTSWAKKKAEDLKKKLIFGPFLGIAFNAFIPICIATNLNTGNFLSTKSGEKIGNIFGVYLWVFAFVWFPLTMLYVIFAGPKKQNDPDFKH